MHYTDLINADGTFNRSAIMKIAATKARAERNLDACVAAMAFAPRSGALSSVTAWRAAAAANLPASTTAYARFFAVELRRVWEIAKLARQRLQAPAVQQFAEAA